MCKLVYKSVFVMLIFSQMFVAVVCPLLVCFVLFVFLFHLISRYIYFCDSFPFLQWVFCLPYFQPVFTGPDLTFWITPWWMGLRPEVKNTIILQMLRALVWMVGLFSFVPGYFNKLSSCCHFCCYLSTNPVLSCCGLFW